MKLLPLIALLLASATAHAEWLLIGENSGNKLYIERAAAKGTWPIRKIWVLTDLSEPVSGIESTKQLMELDCKNEEWHFTFGVGYNKRMGNGSVARTQPMSDKFEPIIPGSSAELIYKVFCQEQQ